MRCTVASTVQLPGVTLAAAARGIAVRALHDAPGASVRLMPWCADARPALPPARPWRALVVVDGGSEALGAGIDAGADDAVARDASTAEVVARLAALLRTVPDTRVAVGGLVLCREDRSVTLSGRSLALLPREFALLLHLAEHAGRTVSRAALLEGVWGRRFDPGTNVVAVHVSRLRARLEAAGPRIVHTDPGGYRLTMPEPSDDCRASDRDRDGEGGR